MFGPEEKGTNTPNNPEAGTDTTLKARQSTAGSRKKGKKKRAEPSDTSRTVAADSIDPNADIIVPKSKEQKDDERKERLLKELVAQSESKVLEKYIDKKLRQEERLQLFEKLGVAQCSHPSHSQTQATMPSLELHSSSTLGTGKVTSNRKRLEKAEDLQVQRTMDGRTGKRRRRITDYSGADSESGDSELDSPPMVSVMDYSSGITVPKKDVQQPPSIVGGALKRNADGTVVQPRVVKKEKGNKTTFRSWKLKASQPVSQQGECDTSFDSSDSAYDTDEGEHKVEGSVEEESGSDSGSELQSGSESSAKGSSPVREEAKKPPLSFKAWAMKQLSAVKGYVAPADEELPKRKVSHPPDGVIRGPLGEEIKLPATALAEHLSKQSSDPSDTKPSKRAKAVSVTRPPDVEEARLPFFFNPVVIICGETGSGKTTQVPQFLYEAGFGDRNGENPGMIGVTQPRRVAAVSMAARVAHELCSNILAAIKFMTDGVLLRELATDFLLSKYSVIIIDEAHERSMNTDILIGVLSRVLKLREQMWKEGKEGIKPLRLIIMSATLRVSDFAENQTLFATPPPVINVDARQHPVTIHFNRRTPSDYVNEAIKKTAKIHARLPPGGILIFLTGQNEITGVCRKLEARFSRKAIEAKKRRRQVVDALSFFVDEPETPVNVVAAAEVALEAEDVDLGSGNHDLALDVDAGDVHEDLEALDSEGEDVMAVDIEESDSPMHVVPLYSLLPSDKQMRVFASPPPGCRLVVVSTNVAETSLTIPGIRYVVDCGRAKERTYDATSGIQSFQISWVSKASAAQRAGRAGRTGPGHCYRLYSSALYEHYFPSFSEPEILRTPIEGIVLQMKSMNIDAVVNFPFPTPPDTHALKKAETTLTHLGALSSSPAVVSGSAQATVSMSTIGGKITSLGRSMSLFPLAPRHARMLVVGRQHGCLPHVITIVSILSVGDPFLREEVLAEAGGSDGEDEENLDYDQRGCASMKEARSARRRAFFEKQQLHAGLGKSTSDILKMLSVVGAYEYAGGGLQFCNEHFVRPKAMEEIHKLRAQISGIVSTTFPGVDTGHQRYLQPPSEKQLKALRQLLAAAFVDQVAVRKDLVEKKSATGVQYSNTKGVAYRALGVSEDVYIHPSSVLSQKSPPDYLIFTEVVRTTKPWLKGLTLINPAWLSSLGKPTLCTFTKPAKNSKGELVTIPKFGPDQWELPPIKVPQQ
ncbi:P-loop containing nucleoside triphosphate hydrolase protein [Pisolithus orientalis]|uniref:P-loop containing nucleoside triphosphate hydrolase protein n=1 Tax=Pisolithus orientalis TaxID=936130 RepID=UPI002224C979|nr:P-loop containing nucleoside triphosphate hydrolase protein [Pisolithus orientalis]KAI6030577.1 P-loop containing nucleoside triphosphate hydrolase protein [Pisolithus orientalis]